MREITFSTLPSITKCYCLNGYVDNIMLLPRHFKMKFLFDYSSVYLSSPNNRSRKYFSQRMTGEEI